MGQAPINVKQPPYRARGNNRNDDTDALQRALDDAAPGGHVILPPGRYRIGATLEVQSFVTVSGRGDRTVIKPLDDSGDDATPVFLLNDVEQVTIRDLRINGNALTMNQQSGHAAVVLAGARRCHLARLSVVNLGKSQADPAGIHILLRANDAMSNPTRLETRRAIPCSGNLIEGCVLRDIAYMASFGIRFQTYWLNDRADDAFTAFVEHNVVRDNHLVGFFWNAIEIAGPATRYNMITGNRVDNPWQVGLEADKGARHNLFAGNRVHQARPHPDPSASNQNKDVTAMRDQGFERAGERRRVAVGNVYTDNRITATRQTLAAVRGRAAGILLSQSRNAVFVGNRIEGVSNAFAGGQACGIAEGDSVEGLTEHSNHIVGVVDRRCRFTS